MRQAVIVNRGDLALLKSGVELQISVNNHLVTLIYEGGGKGKTSRKKQKADSVANTTKYRCKKCGAIVVGRGALGNHVRVKHPKRKRQKAEP